MQPPRVNVLIYRTDLKIKQSFFFLPFYSCKEIINMLMAYIIPSVFASVLIIA